MGCWCEVEEEADDAEGGATIGIAFDLGCDGGLIGWYAVVYTGEIGARFLKGKGDKYKHIKL